MSKTILCKTCCKEIAKNAKTCPGCGAKNKKPIYKKIWFWILILIIFIAIIGNSDNDTSTSQQAIQNTQNNTVITENESVENIPTEYKSALKKAKIYSDTMYMSKACIYDQLTSEYGEKFSVEAAQYAIDNITVDWKENALKKAKSYQETMSMSPAAIYDQLISEYGEKFTAEEAQYAIDNLN